MGASHPKVSVIMNCLNGEKYLRGAIESVYAQTYPHWEIILLDNASTDSTPEIVGSFDQRLRYFRNEKTVPLGQARNQALQHVSGELIGFLDSDDLWLPNKLEKQVPLFQHSPSVGLVFSDTVLRFREEGRSTTYFLNHGYRPPRGRIFSALLKHYSIPMLTVLVRATALKSLSQWFDDRYQVCDDFDFFLRLAYDWECDYADEPLASCLIHGEAATARLHRLGPMEMAMTLDKFRSGYPGFEKKYSREIADMGRQIAYKQGLSYWRDGKKAEARAQFLRYPTSLKSVAAYCTTALPHEWVDGLRQWMKKKTH